MLVGYRCSQGHTWAPDPGAAPASCPICGDTLVMSADPTEPKAAPAFVLSLPPGHQVPGGKDPTLPPGQITPTGSKPAATTNLPSFASLVGMPAPAIAIGANHGSIVPFGEVSDTPNEQSLRAEFAPPEVPGYEILMELGRGGMGVVYKAVQKNLNRPVALKMILAGSHAGPIERERFRREAEAVATLQNPHIVQIFEIGEASGHLYLALEFVDGGSLAQSLVTGPWKAHAAAGLVETLARAVHYAHTQDVVHRDLKPGNVLLASRNREGAEPASGPASRTSLPRFPKITDFGLAKRLSSANDPDRTKTGAVMGTPSYIAPEQASGRTRDVGPSVDIYALGAILYELLTGRPPFIGETPLETVLQVMNDDPVPPKRLQPSVPRDLETICLKCLHKSHAKRYASADALGDDLLRFLHGEPIKARPLSAWGRGVKWARRHPSVTILTTATILATVALLGVLSVAYAQVREAVTQKEWEADASRKARADEEAQRHRAEALARDNEQKRIEADERNEQLRREADRTRRSAFALQLAQIAAMCERNPKRAQELLEDPNRCPPDLRDYTWAYLRRLCQREERIYREHQPNDPLQAVAYSPNGSLVATAGDAGEVRVWDPRTGRTWALLTGHVGRILGVAFSPDGGVIAAAGADRSICLWELPVKMLSDARRFASFLPAVEGRIRPLALPATLVISDAHNDEVNCVAFSPNGHYLVSGGEDGVLRWWDLSGWRGTNPETAIAGGLGVAGTVLARASLSIDGRPVWEYRSIPAHAGGVKSVAFAASGVSLASGGSDRTARVWAPDGANLIRTIGNHADTVLAVALSPDGKILAATNNAANPTVRLINTETGRDIRRLIGHTYAIYALAISAEGDLLASAGFDKTVRLWDIEDGQERGLFSGHELRVSGVVFAPDRKTLISVAMDGVARVWHTTPRTNETAELLRDSTLTTAAISHAGTTIVAGDERGRLVGARTDFTLSRPGGSNANRATNNTLFLTPVFSNDFRGQAIRSTAASSDGQMIFASTDQAIYLWRNLYGPNRRPGANPGSMFNRPVALVVPRPVYAMTVDPTGRWLATLDLEGVRLWDLSLLPTTNERTERVVQPQGPGLILHVAGGREFAFNSTGTRLAIGMGKGIEVIDRTGKVLAKVPMAHPSRIEAVAFGGSDDELLATGDEQGLVRVWHVKADGSIELQADLTGHTEAVYSLAFNPTGRTLASAGSDRNVVLWDPVTGQERASLTGHADWVLRAQFTPDGSALITVGRDGSVKRWRADTRQDTAAQETPVKEPAFHSRP